MNIFSINLNAFLNILYITTEQYLRDISTMQINQVVVEHSTDRTGPYPT